MLDESFLEAAFCVFLSGTGVRGDCFIAGNGDIEYVRVSSNRRIHSSMERFGPRSSASVVRVTTSGIQLPDGVVKVCWR